MAIGTLAWNLMMPHGQVTAGLVATRKELRAAAAVTREMSHPTEMYGTAVDNLNQLLNKNLISVENYRRKYDELKQELKESSPEWERQNALQQRAAEIKEGLRTAENRALGPMREARELRKAGMLTEQQYHDRLAQIKATLPTVVAAEKRLADQRKLAEQITRQNLTAQERYHDAVRRLPAILLTTEQGTRTYRLELERLRREYQGTGDVQQTYMARLRGMSAGRIGGTIAALTGVSLGVAGIGMAARSGLRNYNEFTTSMAHSTAIMGPLSEETLERMRDTARSVSFDVEASAAQAAEGYFFLASAGLNAEESIGALPITSKFAQAGTFDLALATDLLTDAQSALGLNIGNTEQKMANMTRVGDVLTKANVLANASIEQFSKSLTNKAGASLKLVNKDIEEGVAVLAAFADQGVKGEEGGTALAIVMRDLQTKAIHNADAFKKHQVAVYDDNKQMRNMALIVRDLEDRLEGMSDMAKKEILLEMGFSDKSMVFTQMLIGTSDAIVGYEEKLRDAQLTMEEVADKTMSPMTRTLNTLKAGWDEFGGIVLPAIGKGFLESADGTPLEEVVRDFNASIKEMEPLFESIGTAGATAIKSWTNIGNEFAQVGEDFAWFSLKMGEVLGMEKFQGEAGRFATAKEQEKIANLKEELRLRGDLIELDPAVLLRRAAMAAAGLGRQQMNEMMGSDGVADAFSGAGDAMEKTAEQARRLDEALADDAAHDQLAAKLDTFKEKLQEQVDMFGLTGHAAEMAHLRKQGAVAEEIAEHQRLIDLIEEKAEATRAAAEVEREEQQANDSRARQVQSALDSIKTPEMDFEERINELTGWLLAGAITMDQNVQLVEQASAEMAAKLEKDREKIEEPIKISHTIHGGEAGEFGTREHLARVIAFRDRIQEEAQATAAEVAEATSPPREPGGRVMESAERIARVKAAAAERAEVTAQRIRDREAADFERRGERTMAQFQRGQSTPVNHDATNRDIVTAIKELGKNKPEEPAVALAPANFRR